MAPATEVDLLLRYLSLFPGVPEPPAIISALSAEWSQANSIEYQVVEGKRKRM
jgi:hypothetical protein